MNETTTERIRNAYAASEWNISGAFEPARAEFDRWLQQVKAEAWEEGALWAATECGAIRNEQNAFLAPGDNPHRNTTQHQ